MATYTTDITNPPSLTKGEAVIINEGAIVTITNSDWTINGGHGQLDIIFGSLILKNTSTTNGMVVNKSGSSPVVTIYGNGSLFVEGDWISLGTGSGESNQIFSHWGPGYLPCVWIETSAGSGVYEKYLNTSGPGYKHTLDSLSNYNGTKDYGKVFTQRGSGTVSITSGTNTITGANTSFSTDYVAGDVITVGLTTGYEYTISSVNSDTSITITTNAVATVTNGFHYGKKLYFGDGINGYCPPNGSNVRVPNIIIGYKPDNTWSGLVGISMGGSVTNGFGTIIANTAIFSNVGINGGFYEKFSLISCAIGDRFLSSFALGPTKFEDCGMSICRKEDSVGAIPLNFGTSSTIHSQVRVTNVDILAYGSSNYPCVSIIGSSAKDLIIENCLFNTVFSSTTANMRAFSVTVGINIVTNFMIKNCRFRGNFFAHSGVTLKDCEFFMSRPTIANSGFNSDGIVNVNGSNVIIDGLTVYPDGYHGGHVVTFSGASMSNILIKNVDVSETTSGIDAFSKTMANIRPWEVTFQNIKANATTFGIGEANSASFFDNLTSMINVKFSGGPTTQWAGYWPPTGLLMKNVWWDAEMTPNVVSSNSHFHDIRTSTTEGALMLLFNGIGDATSITKTGTTVFDGKWTVYLPKEGDSLTLEYPYKIIGTTGFKNVTPNIGGLNTTNIDFEYAINNGQGYGSWKTLNGTNLSTESVNGVLGFNFKIRLTANTSSVTTSVYRVSVYTNCDNTILYPITQTAIELQNIIGGSQFLIFEKNNPNNVIANGIVDGVGSQIVSISNISYYTDMDIIIRVRKASDGTRYKPFETQGTLTDVLLPIYVTQEIDTIA